MGERRHLHDFNAGLDSCSPSSDDEDNNNETDGNTPSNRGQSLKKSDNPLPPPAPLYYERNEDEGWLDEGEDAQPKTGTPIVLRKSPPKFLATSPLQEPFETSRSCAPTHDGLEPQTFVRPKYISTDGYPNGLRGKLMYDCVQLNAQRRVRRNSSEPAYKALNENDTTLIFDSLFESGNLYQAYQVSEFEYDLVLKNDYNTNGHTQWYYFQIQNTRKQTEYKLNIVNFYKRSSMYSCGLRPLLYSQKAASSDQLGWHRTGHSISYRRNEYHYYKGHDTCYLAHCFPYTYTDLQQYLTKLELDPRIRKIFRRKLLCRSLAGNRCDIVTITNAHRYEDVETSPIEDGKRDKKTVVVSARVHPGESNSSWMMKGCIDFLTSEAPEANHLRDYFVFKIVPMLNPDGVINGSYRTGLAGCDLNRKWKDPSASLHPTIYHFKELLCRIRSEREIALFVDLHGHSVKRNVFMYGCDSVHWKKGENDESRKTPEPNESRLYPALLNNMSKFFSYADCRFHIKPQKESSSRVVCWREFTNNSYTLEASFGGGDAEHEPFNQHYGIHHYEAIGASLCRTMSSFCVEDEKERATLHESILSSVAEIVLPEADSDDEEGEDKGMSSDDDSDDETVDNIVLPAKVSHNERTKQKPARKLSKARNAGARASLSNVVKEFKKIEEKADKQTLARSMQSSSPKREATPRDKDEIKMPVKPQEQRPDRRSPERQASSRKTAPAAPSSLVESVCNCPSCQVYAEFIAAGMPQPRVATANHEAGDSANISRVFQPSGSITPYNASPDTRRGLSSQDKQSGDLSSPSRNRTISVGSPPRHDSFLPAAKDAARSPVGAADRTSPARTAPFTATSMSSRPLRDRADRLPNHLQGNSESRDAASGPQQPSRYPGMIMTSPLGSPGSASSARVSRLRRVM